MRIEQINFPIEEVNWPRSGPKSKGHRIERLEPEFRMGRFLLPEVIHIDDEGNVTEFDATKTKEASHP